MWVRGPRGSEASWVILEVSCGLKLLLTPPHLPWDTDSADNPYPLSTQGSLISRLPPLPALRSLSAECVHSA